MRTSLAFGIHSAICAAAPLVTVAASVAALVVLTRSLTPVPPQPPQPPVIVTITTVVPQVRPVLASPERCDDPIVGTWVARTFRPEAGDWHEYTLHVARTGANLSGTLDLRQWYAGAQDRDIPKCDSSELAITGQHIKATGSITGNSVRIDARSVISHTASTCTDASGYSLDHFAGAIDPSTGVLEMRNNDDAHYAVDREYHFHRAACE